MQHINDEPIPEIYCDKCDCMSNYMGTLGHYDWYRCEACGWEQHIEWEEESNE